MSTRLKRNYTGYPWVEIRVKDNFYFYFSVWRKNKHRSNGQRTALVCITGKGSLVALPSHHKPVQNSPVPRRLAWLHSESILIGCAARIDAVLKRSASLVGVLWSWWRSLLLQCCNQSIETMWLIMTSIKLYCRFIWTSQWWIHTLFKGMVSLWICSF